MNRQQQQKAQAEKDFCLVVGGFMALVALFVASNLWYDIATDRPAFPADCEYVIHGRIETACCGLQNCTCASRCAADMTCREHERCCQQRMVKPPLCVTPGYEVCHNACVPCMHVRSRLCYQRALCVNFTTYCTGTRGVCYDATPSGTVRCLVDIDSGSILPPWTDERPARYSAVNVVLATAATAVAVLYAGVLAVRLSGNFCDSASSIEIDNRGIHHSGSSTPSSYLLEASVPKSYSL